VRIVYRIGHIDGPLVPLTGALTVQPAGDNLLQLTVGDNTIVDC
jgi:hypothetical protein